MRKYVKMAEGLKIREEKRFSNALEYLELCIDRYEYRCINKNDIEWLKKTMKETKLSLKNITKRASLLHSLDMKCIPITLETTT